MVQIIKETLQFPPITTIDFNLKMFKKHSKIVLFFQINKELNILLHEVIYSDRSLNSKKVRNSLLKFYFAFLFSFKTLSALKMKKKEINK